MIEFIIGMLAGAFAVVAIMAAIVVMCGREDEDNIRRLYEEGKDKREN